VNRVGVIGYPVEHSLSPKMHMAAFAALGMVDWQYDKMAIPLDVLGHSIKELRNHGFIGINVTVPHKEAVMKLVRADVTAQMIGAINTVDFRENVGTNTDVIGFMDDLAAYRIDVRDQRIVVLGAGGAARAVVYGLARAGAQVAVVNRSEARAQELARTLLVPMALMTQEQAYDWKPSLIVNCTSVGMHPEVCACPWRDVTPMPEGVTVYDTIYRPARTQLMEKAEAVGGRAYNGVGMLVRQGAAAFKLWTGVEPPIDVMREAVIAGLMDLS
jgi:shikimate dehydrogenase